MLRTLVQEIPEEASILMKHFWPGALTILFKKSELIPNEVVCNQPTVAIRMPSNPIALKLISESNLPLAAPSANLSGRPSPTRADHVFYDLNGRIQCIIDGGDCSVGLESTVIDLSRRLILRPGGVTLEQIQEYLPDVKLYNKKNDQENLEEAPPTPGMKYRHYSPTAQVVLLVGKNLQNMEQLIREQFDLFEKKNKKIGLIHTHTEFSISSSFHIVLNLGGSPEEVGKGLFSALRELDSKKVHFIIMEGIPEIGAGSAVMNRITKAASQICNIDLDNFIFVDDQF